MIVFVPRDHLYHLISSNHAHFDRFCASDWKARGVRNRDEYMQALDVGCFSDIQKQKLRASVKRAIKRVQTFNVEWFHGEMVAKMPWKIGCVLSDTYENGLPHTVGDVIVLTADLVDEMSLHNLATLLIHEQTHVLQRLYPKYARNFLKSYQFRRLKRHTKHDGLRANPDTDGYLYERLGVRYGFRYLTTVCSLSSVRRRHPKYEHPYEEMAYLVEKFTS